MTHKVHDKWATYEIGRDIAKNTGLPGGGPNISLMFIPHSYTVLIIELSIRNGPNL